MDHLLTETRNPASANLDTLSALEIARLMNAEDTRVPGAVASQLEAIARAIEVIAERLRNGGRLIYAGAGTSGRLGVLDASECPPTFNSPPGQIVGVIAGGYQALTTAVEGAEDHPEFGEADLCKISLSAEDVLVGIATSGRTPYVIGALQYARSVGAFAIGLTCVPDSDLAPVAELMIAPLVGPEVLTGSTRLKAGTATKLVLNMLTTGAMVRLGKTFGNLMVDLRATNIKLRARTNRIVRHLVGVNSEEADALLNRCGGELKTALVVGRSELTPDEARQRLAECGGRVGAVLRQAQAASYQPSLCLGIDGGGTRTVALLATMAGGVLQVVGRGGAGPSNLKTVGPAGAFAAIDHAIEAAFAAAGLPRARVGAICIGLAGAGRPADQATVRDWSVNTGLADAIRVTGDVHLPLALLRDGWGVVVVAGTGSCVWGEANDGRTARAGGWGPLLGDEGSAYALGLAGLQAVARQADGREAVTGLTGRVLERAGLRDASEMIGALHSGQWDRTRIAGLAPDVIRAADDGDPAAAHLVSRHVGVLADCVTAVVCRLDLPAERVPIALAGGLLIHAVSYRRRVLERLAEVGVHADPVIQVADPAEGALRLAVGLVSGSASRSAVR